MYSKIISSLLGKSHQQKKEKDKSIQDQKCRGGNTGGHASFTSSDSAPCEHCGRAALSNSSDNSFSAEIMGHKDFVMRWNVKYIGSFPISNTAPDHVASRLDKFRSCQATPAVVAVSMLGVRVHSDDELLFSHSLRRVISVVGRPALREVAYIAMEPAGQTYRRLCHVFRTQETHNVEEIEAVLGSAFQAALARSRLGGVNPAATSTPIQQNMSEKRASSSAFLSRLIGRGGKETIAEDEKSRRKRRPVSAVFSAFQRFSSSATISSSAHKRVTSFEPLSNHFPETPSTRTASSSSPVPEEPVPSRHSKISFDHVPPPVLVYDKDIGENIYPVDETLRAQLDNVNYYVKLPSRELLVRNLLQHPDGAFVVRLSETRKNCLVLSIKVPPAHNASCISHYVIVRNEAGYRIKGFPKAFPSLQMLITHHSVLQEQLPVTLSFVQWNKEHWKQKAVKETHRISRHSYYDENRIPDWMSHQVTPRRRPISVARHSRIFELE